MRVPDIIIAVDGCSSTGKSTFAKRIAKEFDFQYLDSGALYRAVTLFAQENGLIGEDGAVDGKLRGILSGPNPPAVHFGEDRKTWIGDRCVEDLIRSLEVSSQVSFISAEAYVRAFVDAKLHEAGERGRVIMDGRDIGATVFPDAQLKIFMTASEKVRAQRRFDELAAKGGSPSFEEVLSNIRERDYIDSHREVSPLTQPSDAFVLDNSSMTMEEEIAWAKGLIQGKFAILDD